MQIDVITIAINKAFTAARERTPSWAVGEASHRGFPMTNFGDTRYVGWGGGIPLVVDGDVVGAIGVERPPGSRRHRHRRSRGRRTLAVNQRRHRRSPPVTEACDTRSVP